MILYDGYLHGHYLGLHHCSTCLATVYVVRGLRSHTTDVHRYQILLLDPDPGTGREYRWQLNDYRWQASRADKGDDRLREHACDVTARACAHVNARRARIAQRAAA